MENLYLVGMMGVGKSTIGKKLSKEMECEFIDTDDIIESIIGISINEFFETEGEEKFRMIEKDVLSKISPNIGIIATGGGAILDPSNVENMRSLGKIIFLDGNVNTISRNLDSSDVVRPILAKKSIESIIRERRDKYVDSADCTINVNGKDVDEIINQILSIISINK